jgi:penicillin-binding protein 1A
MALMAPEVAADMSRMLRAAVSDTGTGRRAMAPGVRGGKTGTSSEYRDAWFVGATDDLTIGLWVGNDDFSPMDNVTGGTIPADMFKEIAQ